MAQEVAKPNLNRKTIPAKLRWTLGENGQDVPHLNINHGLTLDQIFKKFDVGSVDELSDTTTPDSHRLNELRLGLVVGSGDDMEFYSDTDLLALVDGINTELAEHLIDWFNDIPSMCREIRQDPYLHHLFNDVKVEQDEDEGAWVDELDAGPELERRMKNANVWVEPDDVTAEGH